ncbi:hypothetical protein BB559_001158 [Furculomyces boomerangus]|uniref:Uncharacterized protein n=1 Tax=Furculomyces boomerangus TaxID=61424 RepID=A0A2T9Z313_9FUNG|nr:hypothetical protein BB559_001158 [Furculomyces boomerangus]
MASRKNKPASQGHKPVLQNHKNICYIGNQINDLTFKPALNYARSTSFGKQTVEFYSTQAYPFYYDNIKPAASQSYQIYIEKVHPVVVKISTPVITATKSQALKVQNSIASSYRNSKTIKPFIDSVISRIYGFFDSRIYPITTSINSRVQITIHNYIIPQFQTVRNNYLSPFYKSTLLPLWENRLKPVLSTIGEKLWKLISKDAVPAIRKYSAITLDFIELVVNNYIAPNINKFLNYLTLQYNKSIKPATDILFEKYLKPYFEKYPMLYKVETITINTTKMISKPIQFTFNLFKEVYFLLYEVITGKEHRILKARRIEILRKNAEKEALPKQATTKKAGWVSVDGKWAKEKALAGSEAIVVNAKKAAGWFANQIGNLIAAQQKPETPSPSYIIETVIKGTTVSTKLAPTPTYSKPEHKNVMGTPEANKSVQIQSITSPSSTATEHANKLSIGSESETMYHIQTAINDKNIEDLLLQKSKTESEGISEASLNEEFEKSLEPPEMTEKARDSAPGAMLDVRESMFKVIQPPKELKSEVEIIKEAILEKSLEIPEKIISQLENKISEMIEGKSNLESEHNFETHNNKITIFSTEVSENTVASETPKTQEKSHEIFEEISNSPDEAVLDDIVVDKKLSLHENGSVEPEPIDILVSETTSVESSIKESVIINEPVVVSPEIPENSNLKKGDISEQAENISIEDTLIGGGNLESNKIKEDLEKSDHEYEQKPAEKKENNIDHSGENSITGDNELHNHSSDQPIKDSLDKTLNDDIVSDEHSIDQLLPEYSQSKEYIHEKESVEKVKSNDGDTNEKNKEDISNENNINMRQKPVHVEPEYLQPKESIDEKEKKLEDENSHEKNKEDILKENDINMRQKPVLVELDESVDGDLGNEKDPSLIYAEKDPRKAASDWVKDTKKKISKEIEENRNRENQSRSSQTLVKPKPTETIEDIPLDLKQDDTNKDNKKEAHTPEDVLEKQAKPVENAQAKKDQNIGNNNKRVEHEINETVGAKAAQTPKVTLTLSHTPIPMASVKVIKRKKKQRNN